MDDVLWRRFVRDARGLVANDLFNGVSQVLLLALPGRRRIAERNRLLREAAAMLGDLPPWSKARALREEASIVMRSLPSDPDPSTVRGCIAAAILVRPEKPRLTERQIYNVIRGH